MRTKALDNRPPGNCKQSGRNTDADGTADGQCRRLEEAKFALNSPLEGRRFEPLTETLFRMRYLGAPGCTPAHPETVQTLILRGIFLCRRADVDYFFQGNAADFALDPLGMRAPGAYLDFPAAWEQFVTEIPPQDRGDVVRGLATVFAVQPQNEADRERVLRAASACVAWESSASRLNRDESSQSQPDQRYALMAARISIHYMINGGFLGAGGEPNRDNNYILDRVDRLKEVPVHIVRGRYHRVCHLYQAEALVRALRAVGNNEVNYFITMAGHGSLEPETDANLCAIMNDLPPMSPFDRGGK